MKPLFKIIMIHILGWAAYLFTVVIGVESINHNFWVDIVSAKIPIILLFYGCLYFMYPQYLAPKKYLKLVSILTFFVLFCTLLRFFIAAVLTKFHFIDEISDSALKSEIWKQCRLCLGFVGISLAIWYAQKTKEMEREWLNAEMKALKYQINPHFLYNTLSYLYTESLPLSKELSEAIAKLSAMMRYSLGEVGEDGKVPLDKEVEHLKNFIDIHQLRYDNSLNIDMQITGTLWAYKISPLLLITFIENAFKHGKLTDKNTPLSIQLKIEQDVLYFTIKNATNKSVKEKTSGIGIQNIKNRLNYAYPNKHSLIIEDTLDFYNVYLTIVLKK